MPVETDTAIREILDLNRVAVIGCSTTPGKDAHEVPAYLHEHGYTIIPVNPFADVIFDEPAYDSLGAVPSDTVDIVNVFRPSDEVAGIVDDALGRDDSEIIWTQLGIVDEDAAERAESHGLTVVMDRCMRVEHQRLRG